MAAKNESGRKFKPAGKDATPKICGAQIIKNQKRELEAIKAEEIRHLVPPELLELTIKVIDGGYQEQIRG